MENSLTLNKSKLSKGLFGALLISIGLIYSEKAIEANPGTNDMMMGSMVFLAGWIAFLSSQRYDLIKYGIAVLAIAIIGQIYMGWILEQDESFRRDKIGFTAAFWMAFMTAWITYVYQMSDSDENKMPFLYIGMTLVMMSMLGYFFYRQNDWNTLTGGYVPSIEKDNSIFNQYVILFPLGWALLAIGNSIE
jgi:hypothetical protein